HADKLEGLPAIGRCPKVVLVAETIRLGGFGVPRGLRVRAALPALNRPPRAKAARTHRPRRTPNMLSPGMRSSSLLCVNTNKRSGHYPLLRSLRCRANLLSNANSV